MRPTLLILSVLLACSSATKPGDAGGTDGDGVETSSPGFHTLATSPSPTLMNLCPVDEGKTTAPGTVTVTNTDTAGAVTVMVSASPGLTVTGCDSPLAAGAACTLSVTATPTAPGPIVGSVSITAAPGPSNTVAIGVGCNSTGGPARFSISPTVVDFGDIPMGTLPPPRAITLTGNSTVTDLVVSSSGEDVSIDTLASTCTATLAAGDSCVVVVNFTALSFGRKISDAIHFSSGRVTKSVPVIANVPTPAALAIDPSAPEPLFMNYAETRLTVPFTLTNSGGLATGVLEVALTGADAADFHITRSTCFLLAPLATCTFSVVFEPLLLSAAARIATLTVTDTGSSAFSLSVPLSATVLAP